MSSPPQSAWETDLKARARWNLAIETGTLEIVVGVDRRRGISQRTKFDGFPRFHLVEDEMVAALELSRATGFQTFGVFKYISLPPDPVFASSRFAIRDAFD